MRIADGIEMLELPMRLPDGQISNIYPVVMWDSENIILVDTGMPGQLDLIKNKMEKVGLSFGKIDKVIITHQDMDHIGCLSIIKKELGDGVEVITHKDEKPYIEFEKTPVKMTPQFMAIVEEQIKAASGRPLTVKEVFMTEVDRTVEDGKELDLCGGVQIIYTPGHTPGHLSLYHKKSKTLISGDALVINAGVLSGPEPRFCFDLEEAKKSIKKFEKYDISNIICYHGGIYRENANEAIAGLF